MSFKIAKYILIPILVLIVLVTTSLNSEAIWPFGPKKEKPPKEERVKVGEKLPSRALFWAIVPGSLVHGLGHIYAGKWITGLVLFGVEAGSIGAMLSSSENEGKFDFSTTLPWWGAIGFVGSWVYDIMASPEAAIEYNERKRASSQFKLKIDTSSPDRKAFIIIGRNF